MINNFFRLVNLSLSTCLIVSCSFFCMIHWSLPVLKKFLQPFFFVTLFHILPIIKINTMYLLLYVNKINKVDRIFFVEKQLKLQWSLFKHIQAWGWPEEKKNGKHIYKNKRAIKFQTILIGFFSSSMYSAYSLELTLHSFFLILIFLLFLT